MKWVRRPDKRVIDQSAVNNKYGSGRLREPLRWVALVAVIVLVIASGRLVWRHYHKSQPTSVASFLKQDADNASKYSQDYLKNGDYANYQNGQSSIAQNYLNNNDPKDALSYMNEVFAKVPAGKINYESYATMVGVQRALNNKSKEKFYDQKLIDLLQAQGDSAGAQDIKQQMDKL